MKSPLPGVKVMLIGPTGTGKTTSLKTLIKCGITPMCLFTEPGFDVLGDLPLDQLCWKYVSPTSESLDSILDKATKAATMTYKAMTELYDPMRNRDNKFIEMVKVFNNFTDDRTGKSYGPVAKWGTDRALVIDSLTGLGMAVMHSIIGCKPVKTQAEWGIAQDQLEGVINWACTSIKCHFVLVAHAEREVDEVSGGMQIMASTLGKKLAPKLPRFFSDCILCQRQGTKFSWSTATAGADTKARNVPVANDIPPDFGIILENWKSRGGIIES